MNQHHDLQATTFLNQLTHLITTYFSLEELKDLCFQLGVNFDSLDSTGQKGKTRELVLYKARRGQLTHLLAIVRELRVAIDWPEMSLDFDLSRAMVAVSDPAPSVPGRVIVFARQPEIFLSYATADIPYAQHVGASLQALGMRIWPQTTPSPDSLQTEQAIRRAHAVLIVTTTAVNSAEVQADIAFTQEMGKPLLFLIMADHIAPSFPPNQTILLYENWEVGIQSTIAHLHQLIASSLSRSEPVTTRPWKPQPSTIKGTTSGNPFIVGPSVPPEYFVGRAASLRTIAGHVGNEASLQHLSIVANRRMGKSSLLRYIAERYRTLFTSGSDYVTAYLDVSISAEACTIPGLMRMLRRAVQRQTGYALWSETDDGRVFRLTETLEELADQNVRLVLLLDEWDSVMAYPELNSLIEAIRSNAQESKVGLITATAYSLIDLMKESKLTSPFFNIFTEHVLSNFTEPEWQGLITAYFARSGREVSVEQMALISELAGGHPHLTQLAGRLLWEAREEGWTLAEVRREFDWQAQPLVFVSLWKWLNSRPGRIQAIRNSLGLAPPAAVSENVRRELTRRGVLNKDGEIFSNAFAGYLRQEFS